MFDANMRYKPKFSRFYAKVAYWNRNVIGLNKGDTVLYTMLDEDSDDPRVILHLDTPITIKHSDNFYDKLLTFERFL